MQKSIKYSIVGVLAFLAFIVLINSFTVVGTQDVGVVLNWSAFNGQMLKPGLHVKIPFVQSVIGVNVQQRKIEIGSSEAYSHDLQVVDIHSVVNYNIDENSAGEVYKKYQLGFESKVLVARVEASVKQTIAKYTAEELLSKRSEVSGQIEQAIKDSFPSQFVGIRYALVNESFSSEFEKAIELKQVAQQKAEQAKNELTKAQIDADSRIAQAKGEAEAIKIQAQAIEQQGGSNYVQLQAIGKWDGHLPNQMIPGATVPFLNLVK